MASSIFSSTEKASATSSTSLAGNTKTSESSSASIDTPDANHTKEAYTENPRWTNDKASRLASLNGFLGQSDESAWIQRNHQ